MSEDRKKATQSEVQKLLDVVVIREVQYPESLANVVMVPKKNGSWRMCIDFTTLNKFCQKDGFPLPRIDTLVDVAVGSEMLSMLDCFTDYHQIFMKKNPMKRRPASQLPSARTVM
jgi:putative transposase